MAKRRKSRKTMVPRKKADLAFPLYYDEERLYGRTSAKLVTRTVLPVGGEGELFPQIADNTIPPNGAVTWYLNGPQGSAFQTSLAFQGGGGHAHSSGSTDARATGTIAPASGTLSGPYPQNVVQTYRAGAFCGIVHDHSVIGGTVFENDYTIAIAGLASLGASTGVVLVGTTAQHPSNHWGVPALCSQIAALGAAFHAEFKKPIYVNDMSLQTGGFFDVNGDFAAPHQTHQDGRNVDVNWSSMTDKERAWFKSKAESLGFRVELHPNPNHWHLII